MQRTVLGSLGALVFIAVGAVFAAHRLIPSPHAVTQTSLETTLHDYILAHPEVLVESVSRMQQSQALKAKDARAAIIAHRAELLDDPASQVAGNPKGDATIVLFFDYRCPYCKEGVAQEKALLSFDPGVRIIYKEFPILGPQSVVAARAALAAVKQGKYLPFHDAMMAYHGDFSDAEIFDLAEDSGLDVARLRKDMKGDDITAILQRNFRLAQALGIGGTPAYVVGDHLVGGVTTAADFERLIEEARDQRLRGAGTVTGRR